MTVPRANSGTTYYEGPPKRERRVRVEYPSGKIKYYEGPYENERVVRVEEPEYLIVYYEGEEGKEVPTHTVRKKWKNDPFPADGRHTAWSDAQIAYSWSLITGPWMARYVNAGGMLPNTETMNQAQVPFEEIRDAILKNGNLMNTLGMIVDYTDDLNDKWKNEQYLKAIRNKMAGTRNPEALRYGLTDWALLLGRGQEHRNLLRDIPAPNPIAGEQQPMDASYF
jgi:hypothetical protein